MTTHPPIETPVVTPESPPDTAPIGIAVESLMALGDQDKRYEVWNGNLQEKPMATAKHGKICARLVARLTIFCEQHQRGDVYTEGTTYAIEGTRQDLKKALMPDVSFIRHDQSSQIDEDDFIFIPPDLAIEVISSSERPSEVQAKVTAFLSFGAGEVWSVYPDDGLIIIYRQTGAPAAYRVGDSIPMQGALEGLILTVNDIFGVTESA